MTTSGLFEMRANTLPRRFFSLVLTLSLMVWALSGGSAFAQSFTAGNIAVLDLAAGTANTSASILELKPFGAAQTPVQPLIAISPTGASAMRFSNSGTSSYLSISNDGSLLIFTGYNTTDTTDADLATVTALDPATDRAVGTLDSSTNFILQTTYTGASTNQTRSATSLNNTAFFITDKGGLYTNGATNPPPYAVNIGEAKCFGGTVYISSTRTVAQGNISNAAIGTVASPTASSVTGLPGIAIDTGIVDFYLIQSGSNGTTYDILYKLDGITIIKYSLVAGTWVSNGTYTSGSAGLALIAANNGNGGADIYYTTGTSVLRIKP